VVVSESFVRFIWFKMSGVAMFYVFRKKGGFVWSFVCWYSRIIEVLLSLVANLINVPMTWLDLNVFVWF
jgi:hypothetical protein